MKKVLLVDDDEAVLDLMSARLASRYSIMTTTDADKVIGLARSEKPDIIVCDVDMPDMDGGDVSAALFGDEELRHIPLLFLTALASAADIRRLQGQIGGRPALSKSAPLDELVARIEALIGG